VAGYDWSDVVWTISVGFGGEVGWGRLFETLRRAKIGINPFLRARILLHKRKARTSAQEKAEGKKKAWDASLTK